VEIPGESGTYKCTIQRRQEINSIRLMGQFSFSYFVYCTTNHQGRVIYFSGMPRQGEEEEETVIIVMHLCEPSMASMDRRILAMHARHQDYPKKMPSVHHCVRDSSSPLFKLFLNMLLKPIGLEHRARIKIHTGTLNKIHSLWLVFCLLSMSFFAWLTCVFG
jgi:hypothetical protein